MQIEKQTGIKLKELTEDLLFDLDLIDAQKIVNEFDLLLKNISVIEKIDVSNIQPLHNLVSKTELDLNADIVADSIPQEIIFQNVQNNTDNFIFIEKLVNNDN